MISNELLKKKIIEHYLYEVNYKKQQLKEIAEFKSGKTPQSTEICKSGNIPYYKVSDMNLVENKVYMNKNINYLREIGSYKLFPKHSIIFPKNGGALLTNKKRILTVDSLVDLNTGVLIPNEKIFYKYLYYFMLLVDFKYYFKGTALPTIDSKKFLEIIMPVPPSEEQEKIVKKIEELFELIDKKEKNNKEKEKLKTLLKEKILDSAIHGKLVENDLSLPAIDIEEIKENIPFDIPSNWKWCFYKNIGDSGIGLTYKPSNINNTGMIVLRSSNIQEGKLDLKDIVRVDCKVKDNIIARENDILICARNGSKRLIGKSCLLKNLNEKMTYGAFMTIFRTPYYRYVYWFMQSKHYYNQLHENTNTMTINQITQKKLGSLLVPIPPLEQQKKIVEKIEECFKLIEQL